LAIQWKKYGFKPRLYVITTADVKAISGIKSYGFSKNVEVIHLKAYYKQTSDSLKFKFLESQ